MDSYKLIGILLCEHTKYLFGTAMVSCWVGALPGWAVPIELAQGQLTSDASLRIAMMSDGRLLCGDRPPRATAPRCHRRVAVWPAGQGHLRERLPLPRGRQRGVRLVLSTTGRGHERLHRR